MIAKMERVYELKDIPFSYDELRQMSDVPDEQWDEYTQEQYGWMISRLIATIIKTNEAITFPIRNSNKKYREAEDRRLLAGGLLDMLYKRREVNRRRPLHRLS